MDEIPPPSPLTGCYLLIVIGEPHSREHKEIIIQRLIKGFLSWDTTEYGVDLEKELATITASAPEGESARNGERLIQFASEHLVTEVLIHPQMNTLMQCMRNLLSSFTRHRHLIHAGYTYTGNGSWIMQDGTFSVFDFEDAFQENEVQRVIRAYENTISIDIHCSGEEHWSKIGDDSHLCKIRINPNDILDVTGSIKEFIGYLEPYIVPASVEDLLVSSDVVGNIRFTHPTLYIFPGGQGDAALFGINGFNMLVDGGFSRKSCWWDFVRHLDRLDAVMLTRINNCSVAGMASALQRKAVSNVYPQIGHFFCNLEERRASTSSEGKNDDDPLSVSLHHEGNTMMSNLRTLKLKPQPCYRSGEPVNLYHKVGHGTLDMFVLNPTQDSKHVKEFLDKWHNGDTSMFSTKFKTRNISFPIPNLVSICALLVWRPADPEANVTRLMFPGSAPQNKIFEGLDRLQHLTCLKKTICSTREYTESLKITTKTTKTSTTRHTIRKKESKLSDFSREFAEIKKDNVIDNKLLTEMTDKYGDDKIKSIIESGLLNETIGRVDVELTNELKKEREDKRVKKKETVKRTEKQEVLKETKKNEQKSEVKAEYTKNKVIKSTRASVEKKLSEKKTENDEYKKKSPTTPSIVDKTIPKKKREPKKIEDANDTKSATKEIIKSMTKRISPSRIGGKSAKEESNRKVLERTLKSTVKPISTATEKKEKPKREPISRRPKLIQSPMKSLRSSKSPIKKLKPKDERQRALLDDEEHLKEFKKSDEETSKSLDDTKQQEFDEREEQEIVKEIEAVFNRDSETDDKIDFEARSDIEKLAQASIAALKDTIQIDGEFEEEYLIIETEEAEDSADNDKEKQIIDNKESEKKIRNDTYRILTQQGPAIVETKSDKQKPSPEMIESLPEEKASNTFESGATTAPTLPDDEKAVSGTEKDNVPDEAEKVDQEEIKEKYLSENVERIKGIAEKETEIQASPIREIVKTPDEVADLPLHEEVDYKPTEELSKEIEFDVFKMKPNIGFVREIQTPRELPLQPTQTETVNEREESVVIKTVQKVSHPEVITLTPGSAPESPAIEVARNEIEETRKTSVATKPEITELRETHITTLDSPLKHDTSENNLEKFRSIPEEKETDDGEKEIKRLPTPVEIEKIVADVAEVLKSAKTLEELMLQKEETVASGAPPEEPKAEKSPSPIDSPMKSMSEQFEAENTITELEKLAAEEIKKQSLRKSSVEIIKETLNDTVVADILKTEGKYHHENFSTGEKCEDLLDRSFSVADINYQKEIPTCEVSSELKIEELEHKTDDSKENSIEATRREQELYSVDSLSPPSQEQVDVVTKVEIEEIYPKRKESTHHLKQIDGEYQVEEPRKDSLIEDSILVQVCEKTLSEDMIHLRLQNEVVDEADKQMKSEMTDIRDDEKIKTERNLSEKVIEITESIKDDLEEKISGIENKLEEAIIKEPKSAKDTDNTVTVLHEAQIAESNDDDIRLKTSRKASGAEEKEQIIKESTSKSYQISSNHEETINFEIKPQSPSQASQILLEKDSIISQPNKTINAKELDSPGSEIQQTENIPSIVPSRKLSVSEEKIQRSEKIETISPNKEQDILTTETSRIFTDENQVSIEIQSKLPAQVDDNLLDMDSITPDASKTALAEVVKKSDSLTSDIHIEDDISSIEMNKKVSVSEYEIESKEKTESISPKKEKDTHSIETSRKSSINEKSISFDKKTGVEVELLEKGSSTSDASKTALAEVEKKTDSLSSEIHLEKDASPIEMSKKVSVSEYEIQSKEKTESISTKKEKDTHSTETSRKSSIDETPISVEIKRESPTLADEKLLGKDSIMPDASKTALAEVVLKSDSLTSDIHFEEDISSIEMSKKVFVSEYEIESKEKRESISPKKEKDTRSTETSRKSSIDAKSIRVDKKTEVEVELLETDSVSSDAIKTALAEVEKKSDSLSSEIHLEKDASPIEMSKKVSVSEYEIQSKEKTESISTKKEKDTHSTETSQKSSIDETPISVEIKTESPTQVDEKLLDKDSITPDARKTALAEVVKKSDSLTSDIHLEEDISSIEMSKKVSVSEYEIQSKEKPESISPKKEEDTPSTETSRKSSIDEKSISIVKKTGVEVELLEKDSSTSDASKTALVEVEKKSDSLSSDIHLEKDASPIEMSKKISVSEYEIQSKEKTESISTKREKDTHSTETSQKSSIAETPISVEIKTESPTQVDEKLLDKDSITPDASKTALAEVVKKSHSLRSDIHLEEDISSIEMCKKVFVSEYEIQSKEKTESISPKKEKDTHSTETSRKSSIDEKSISVDKKTEVEVELLEKDSITSDASKTALAEVLKKSDSLTSEIHLEEDISPIEMSKKVSVSEYEIESKEKPESISPKKEKDTPSTETSRKSSIDEKSISVDKKTEVEVELLEKDSISSDTSKTALVEVEKKSGSLSSDIHLEKDASPIEMSKKISVSEYEIQSKEKTESISTKREKDTHSTETSQKSSIAETPISVEIKTESPTQVDEKLLDKDSITPDASKTALAEVVKKSHSLRSDIHLEEDISSIEMCKKVFVSEYEIQSKEKTESISPKKEKDTHSTETSRKSSIDEKSISVDKKTEVEVELLEKDSITSDASKTALAEVLKKSDSLTSEIHLEEDISPIEMSKKVSLSEYEIESKEKPESISPKKEKDTPSTETSRKSSIDEKSISVDKKTEVEVELLEKDSISSDTSKTALAEVLKKSDSLTSEIHLEEEISPIEMSKKVSESEYEIESKEKTEPISPKKEEDTPSTETSRKSSIDEKSIRVDKKTEVEVELLETDSVSSDAIKTALAEVEKKSDSLSSEIHLEKDASPIEMSKKVSVSEYEIQSKEKTESITPKKEKDTRSTETSRKPSIDEKSIRVDKKTEVEVELLETDSVSSDAIKTALAEVEKKSDSLSSEIHLEKDASPIEMSEKVSVSENEIQSKEKTESLSPKKEKHTSSTETSRKSSIDEKSISIVKKTGVEVELLEKDSSTSDASKTALAEVEKKTDSLSSEIHLEKDASPIEMSKKVSVSEYEIQSKEKTESISTKKGKDTHSTETSQKSSIDETPISDEIKTESPTQVDEKLLDKDSNTPDASKTALAEVVKKSDSLTSDIHLEEDISSIEMSKKVSVSEYEIQSKEKTELISPKKEKDTHSTEISRKSSIDEKSISVDKKIEVEVELLEKDSITSDASKTALAEVLKKSDSLISEIHLEEDISPIEMSKKVSVSEYEIESKEKPESISPKKEKDTHSTKTSRKSSIDEKSISFDKKTEVEVELFEKDSITSDASKTALAEVLKKSDSLTSEIHLEEEISPIEMSKKVSVSEYEIESKEKTEPISPKNEKDTRSTETSRKSSIDEKAISVEIKTESPTQVDEKLLDKDSITPDAGKTALAKVVKKSDSLTSDIHLEEDISSIEMSKKVSVSEYEIQSKEKPESISPKKEEDTPSTETSRKSSIDEKSISIVKKTGVEVELLEKDSSTSDASKTALVEVEKKSDSLTSDIHLEKDASPIEMSKEISVSEYEIQSKEKTESISTKREKDTHSTETSQKSSIAETPISVEIKTESPTQVDEKLLDKDSITPDASKTALAEVVKKSDSLTSDIHLEEDISSIEMSKKVSVSEYEIQSKEKPESISPKKEEDTPSTETSRKSSIDEKSISVDKKTEVEVELLEKDSITSDASKTALAEVLKKSDSLTSEIHREEDISSIEMSKKVSVSDYEIQSKEKTESIAPEKEKNTQSTVISRKSSKDEKPISFEIETESPTRVDNKLLDKDSITSDVSQSSLTEEVIKPDSLKSDIKLEEDMISIDMSKKVSVSENEMQSKEQSKSISPEKEEDVLSTELERKSPIEKPISVEIKPESPSQVDDKLLEKDSITHDASKKALTEEVIQLDPLTSDIHVEEDTISTEVSRKVSVSVDEMQRKEKSKSISPEKEKDVFSIEIERKSLIEKPIRVEIKPETPSQVNDKLLEKDSMTPDASKIALTQEVIQSDSPTSDFHLEEDISSSEMRRKVSVSENEMQSKEKTESIAPEKEKNTHSTVISRKSSKDEKPISFEILTESPTRVDNKLLEMDSITSDVSQSALTEEVIKPDSLKSDIKLEEDVISIDMSREVSVSENEMQSKEKSKSMSPEKGKDVFSTEIEQKSPIEKPISVEMKPESPSQVDDKLLEKDSISPDASKKALTEEVIQLDSLTSDIHVEEDTISTEVSRNVSVTVDEMQRKKKSKSISPEKEKDVFSIEIERKSPIEKPIRVEIKPESPSQVNDKLLEKDSMTPDASKIALTEEVIQSDSPTSDFNLEEDISSSEMSRKVSVSENEMQSKEKSKSISPEKEKDVFSTEITRKSSMDEKSISVEIKAKSTSQVDKKSLEKDSITSDASKTPLIEEFILPDSLTSDIHLEEDVSLSNDKMPISVKIKAESPSQFDDKPLEQDSITSYKSKTASIELVIKSDSLKSDIHGEKDISSFDTSSKFTVPGCEMQSTEETELISSQKAKYMFSSDTSRKSLIDEEPISVDIKAESPSPIDDELLEKDLITSDASKTVLTEEVTKSESLTSDIHLEEDISPVGMSKKVSVSQDEIQSKKKTESISPKKDNVIFSTELSGKSTVDEMPLSVEIKAESPSQVDDKQFEEELITSDASKLTEALTEELIKQHSLISNINLQKDIPSIVTSSQLSVSEDVVQSKEKTELISPKIEESKYYTETSRKSSLDEKLISVDIKPEVDVELFKKDSITSDAGKAVSSKEVIKQDSQTVHLEEEISLIETGRKLSVSSEHKMPSREKTETRSPKEGEEIFINETSQKYFISEKPISVEIKPESPSQVDDKLLEMDSITSDASQTALTEVVKKPDSLTSDIHLEEDISSIEVSRKESVSEDEMQSKEKTELISPKKEKDTHSTETSRKYSIDEKPISVDIKTEVYVQLLEEDTITSDASKEALAEMVKKPDSLTSDINVDEDISSIETSRKVSVSEDEMQSKEKTELISPRGEKDTHSTEASRKSSIDKKTISVHIEPEVDVQLLEKDSITSEASKTVSTKEALKPDSQQTDISTEEVNSFETSNKVFLSEDEMKIIEKTELISPREEKDTHSTEVSRKFSIDKKTISVHIEPEVDVELLEKDSITSDASKTVSTREALKPDSQQTDISTEEVNSFETSNKVSATEDVMQSNEKTELISPREEKDTNSIEASRKSSSDEKSISVEIKPKVDVELLEKDSITSDASKTVSTREALKPDSQQTDISTEEVNSFETSNKVSATEDVMQSNEKTELISPREEKDTNSIEASRKSSSDEKSISVEIKPKVDVDLLEKDPLTSDAGKTVSIKEVIKPDSQTLNVHLKEEITLIETDRKLSASSEHKMQSNEKTETTSPKKEDKMFVTEIGRISIDEKPINIEIKPESLSEVDDKLLAKDSITANASNPDPNEEVTIPDFSKLGIHLEENSIKVETIRKLSASEDKIQGEEKTELISPKNEKDMLSFETSQISSIDEKPISIDIKAESPDQIDDKLLEKDTILSDASKIAFTKDVMKSGSVTSDIHLEKDMSSIETSRKLAVSENEIQSKEKEESISPEKEKVMFSTVISRKSAKDEKPLVEIKSESPTQFDEKLLGKDSITSDARKTALTEAVVRPDSLTSDINLEEDITSIETNRKFSVSQDKMQRMEKSETISAQKEEDIFSTEISQKSSIDEKPISFQVTDESPSQIDDKLDTQLVEDISSTESSRRTSLSEERFQSKDLPESLSPKKQKSMISAETSRKSSINDKQISIEIKPDLPSQFTKKQLEKDHITLEASKTVSTQVFKPDSSTSDIPSTEANEKISIPEEKIQRYEIIESISPKNYSITSEIRGVVLTEEDKKLDSSTSKILLEKDLSTETSRQISPSEEKVELKDKVKSVSPKKEVDMLIADTSAKFSTNEKSINIEIKPESESHVDDSLTSNVSKTALTEEDVKPDIPSSDIHLVKDIISIERSGEILIYGQTLQSEKDLSSGETSRKSSIMSVDALTEGFVTQKEDKLPSVKARIPLQRDMLSTENNAERSTKIDSKSVVEEENRKPSIDDHLIKVEIASKSSSKMDGLISETSKTALTENEDDTHNEVGDQLKSSSPILEKSEDDNASIVVNKIDELNEIASRKGQRQSPSIDSEASQQIAIDVKNLNSKSSDVEFETENSGTGHETTELFKHLEGSQTMTSASEEAMLHRETVYSEEDERRNEVTATVLKDSFIHNNLSLLKDNTVDNSRKIAVFVTKEENDLEGGIHETITIKADFKDKDELKNRERFSSSSNHETISPTSKGDTHVVAEYESSDITRKTSIISLDEETVSETESPKDKNIKYEAFIEQQSNDKDSCGVTVQSRGSEITTKSTVEASSILKTTAIREVTSSDCKQSEREIKESTQDMTSTKSNKIIKYIEQESIPEGMNKTLESVSLMKSSTQDIAASEIESSAIIGKKEAENVCIATLVDDENLTLKKKNYSEKYLSEVSEKHEYCEAGVPSQLDANYETVQQGIKSDFLESGSFYEGISTPSTAPVSPQHKFDFESLPLKDIEHKSESELLEESITKTIQVGDDTVTQRISTSTEKLSKTDSEIFDLQQSVGKIHTETDTVTKIIKEGENVVTQTVTTVTTKEVMTKDDGTPQTIKTTIETTTVCKGSDGTVSTKKDTQTIFSECVSSLSSCSTTQEKYSSADHILALDSLKSDSGDHGLDHESLGDSSSVIVEDNIEDTTIDTDVSKKVVKEDGIDIVETITTVTKRETINISSEIKRIKTTIEKTTLKEFPDGSSTIQKDVSAKTEEVSTVDIEDEYCKDFILVKEHEHIVDTVESKIYKDGVEIIQLVDVKTVETEYEDPAKTIKRVKTVTLTTTTEKYPDASAKVLTDKKIEIKDIPIHDTNGLSKIIPDNKIKIEKDHRETGVTGDDNNSFITEKDSISESEKAVTSTATSGKSKNVDNLPCKEEENETLENKDSEKSPTIQQDLKSIRILNLNETKSNNIKTKKSPVGDITKDVQNLTKTINKDGIEITQTITILTTREVISPDKVKVTVETTTVSKGSDGVTKTAKSTKTTISEYSEEYEESTDASDIVEELIPVKEPKLSLTSDFVHTIDSEDELGSPSSVKSQHPHSPRSDLSFDMSEKRFSTDKNVTDNDPYLHHESHDPMSMSCYGALPESFDTVSHITSKFIDKETEHSRSLDASLAAKNQTVEDLTGVSTFLDEAEKQFEESYEEHKRVFGESKMSTISSKYELKSDGESSVSTLIEKQSTTKDETSESTTTASTINENVKDPIESWGKPLGLPSPTMPSDRGTPKKQVHPKTKMSNEKPRTRAGESPSKKMDTTPVYMDLTYVPHHGNSYYSALDFFKRVRARYYVFSGTEPSKEIYNALLDAKKTWEDEDLEVTIIPTYDTDVLGYWVTENEEQLERYKIDLSPSASRCTINLQDHDSSCAAYRLEF